ncbi:GNAT family N-acetyltransferase [Paenibacillus sp. AD87]|uniref:GNAT family N-acetyltransferase n=1 Tax=Paenibacillus sp. AD87 TaxID=1528787 RepID=UPI0007E37496|nr:GNAT family N-acetyltransferase [Paenibacillus sp. AD87]OAX48059.1 putative acetyltransferase YjbC [Paenibacillus sp. AD87]
MLQKRFDQVFEIMKQSFPEAEYREYSEQKKLLSNSCYRLLTEENEQNEVTGFLAGWEFESFKYIEHLAVSPNIRGGGIGKRLMERYMKQTAKPVILEVELPEDEMKRRRIGFYERLGFCLGDHSYVQPPLRAVGQETLSLQIMSYPAKLNPTQFEMVKKMLYKEVYGAPSAYAHASNN